MQRQRFLVSAHRLVSESSIMSIGARCIFEIVNVSDATQEEYFWGHVYQQQEW